MDGLVPSELFELQLDLSRASTLAFLTGGKDRRFFLDVGVEVGGELDEKAIECGQFGEPGHETLGSFLNGYNIPKKRVILNTAQTQ